MLQDSKAFSGYGVKDIESTVAFYRDVLGLEVADTGMGLEVRLGTGANIFLYVREHHEPAGFTVLNFPVDDIEAAVDELVSKGVVFEHYDSLPAEQDDKQILWGENVGFGPNIAWFKDPSGNTLSVLQDS